MILRKLRSNLIISDLISQTFQISIKLRVGILTSRYNLTKIHWSWRSLHLFILRYYRMSDRNVFLRLISIWIIKVKSRCSLSWLLRASSHMWYRSLILQYNIISFAYLLRQVRLLNWKLRVYYLITFESQMFHRWCPRILNVFVWFLMSLPRAIMVSQLYTRYN
jgi:hypothetical protein